MADRLDLVCSYLLKGEGPMVVYSDRIGNSELARIAVLDDFTIHELKKEFPDQDSFYLGYKNVIFNLV